jgi:FixJ family two-component response regulator
VSTALEESNGEAARNAMMAEMRARLEHLTPAENEVIEAMLDGLANKQIAQRLSIGLRTVELRRSKIMRKMQAKSVAELVKFICMSGRLCSRGAPTDS